RPLRRTLAEDGQPRNGAQLASLVGALVRLALVPTRCSCTMHCKEQAGNNGIGPAMVSYSRRLVRRRARGLRDFPPSPVSDSMVWLSLAGLEERAPLRPGARRRNKKPAAAPRAGRLAQIW